MSAVRGFDTEQLVVEWVQEDVAATPEAPLLMSDPRLVSQCETICSELRPIGARRKGRRKGCKNRPPVQRHQQAEAKKKVKNAKERKRVQNIHHEYSLLRELLGDRSEKLSKLQVLNATIEYIKHLSEKLSESEDSNSSNVGCIQGPPPPLSITPSLFSRAESMPSEYSLSPFSVSTSTDDGSCPTESSSGHHFQYCAEYGSHAKLSLTCDDSYAEEITCQSPQLVHVPAVELMVTVQPAAGSPWLLSHSLPPPLSHFTYQ